MDAEAQPPTRLVKQAVVLVHGMGEQVPMETLRGFVETMWVRDPAINAGGAADKSVKGNPIWWKPDSRTGSLELSRITTRSGRATGQPARDGQRTDFYEFYWADLTDANTITQLKDWLQSLLIRWPWQVPQDVKLAWYTLWLLTLGVSGFAFWAGLHKAGFTDTFPLWAKIVLGVGVAVQGVAVTAALRTFGDVARYVRAKPPNIAARRAVRERGLILLRSLSDSGQYDRIVVVAHSLGSIVAYDLMRFFWSERDSARTMEDASPLYQAFQAAIAAANTLNAADSATQHAARDAYRVAQHGVFQAMQRPESQACPWLISDFVTVGSPLAHAAFLLARDAEAFKAGIDERRYPSCPPMFEDGNGCLYRPDPVAHPHRWEAHHATPFSAVRWSNIYDAGKGIVLGDLISGPLVPVLGKGIVDQKVTIRRNSWIWPRFFTHTLYWTHTDVSSPQLPLLRAALVLTRPSLLAGQPASPAVLSQADQAASPRRAR